MIWLGLLFLVAAIYNLVIGDYLNAIAGIGIALALIILGILWPDLTSTVEKVKLIGAVLIPIVVIFYILYGVVSEIEISTNDYEMVAKFKAMHEGNNAIINAAMEDGKITLPEFYEIKELYNRLRKESAINTINEK